MLAKRFWSVAKFVLILHRSGVAVLVVLLLTVVMTSLVCPLGFLPLEVFLTLHSSQLLQNKPPLVIVLMLILLSHTPVDIQQSSQYVFG